MLFEQGVGGENRITVPLYVREYFLRLFFNGFGEKTCFGKLTPYGGADKIAANALEGNITA